MSVGEGGPTGNLRDPAGGGLFSFPTEGPPTWDTGSTRLTLQCLKVHLENTLVSFSLVLVAYDLDQEGHHLSCGYQITLIAAGSQEKTRKHGADITFSPSLQLVKY